MLPFAIAAVMLVTLIAIVVSYSIGYDAALGKPRTEEHMRPGTRYAHGYGFIEVGMDGTQRRLALLHNLDERHAEYCTLREPVPAAQVVAVVGSDGKTRLQPAPAVCAGAAHIDATA